jgi:hypothetical protein
MLDAMDVTGWLVLLVLLGSAAVVTAVRLVHRSHPAREFLHLGFHEQFLFANAVKQDDELPAPLRMAALPLLVLLVAGSMPVPLPLSWATRLLLLAAGLTAFVLLVALVPRSNLQSAAALARRKNEVTPRHVGLQRLIRQWPPTWSGDPHR